MKTMKMKHFAVVAGTVLLSVAAACRSNDSKSDVMEDTALNQDTAYQTDTIIPGSTDPRHEGIQGNQRSDSIRVKKAPAPGSEENK